VTGLNTVALAWQYSSTKGKGFKIQRRLGTSGSWSLLVKLPLGTTAYTDGTVTPCQLYSYRVKSYSSSASTPSNEVVITAGAPGAFTLTGSAECSGNNPQNRLQWTTSIAATSYDVYRNGALLASGQAGPTYLDSAVTAGQNYLYQVAARNSCGAHDSNEVGVTALTTCCPAPGALTLTATADCAGGSPRIALSWTSSSGATAYDVYRNGVSYAPSQAGTTYTDTAVTASTTYNYYIAARNSCGQTQSNTATVTAGSAPGAFTLTVTPECYSGQPSISLQWTAASGVTSSSSYDVYRDGSLLATNRDQTITWHDAPLAAGSTHSYYIRAKNSCGTKDSNTASATAPTSCCTPPGNFTLTVTPGCHSGTPVLFIHWTAATGVPTTDSYDIYRDGSLLVADRDQTITWYDPAVAPGSTHSYFIRAKNSCSTTDSNTASAVVPSTCPTIVDEQDAGFVEQPALPGPWHDYSSSYCYDGHMYYLDNEHDVGVNYGRWYPNLPGAGWYTVSAFIGCRFNATVNARYWINGPTGSGPYVMNQYLYCYNWATIGNFHMMDDGTDYLYLSNYTGGVEPDNTTTVQFDAVSWAP
jgi:hypothetical protein